MAGISQTIPSYYGGISQQADELKHSGQVKDIINGIPDLTYGLYKRPGAKRITSPDTQGKLANVQSGGTWFHYYRDEDEGSYVGQIAADGTPRIWKASGDNAGDEQTIAYGSTDGANSTNLKAYLATATPENIQNITINDTTLFCNRSKEVLLTADTATAKPEAYAAYIEVLRTENGRQYALNLHDSDTTTAVQVATRINIKSSTLSTAWGTGNCPGIGVQVFGHSETYAGKAGGVSSDAKNLIFRITTLGQVGDNSQDDNDSVSANGFRCAYSKSVDLLHGGTDWHSGDETTVTLTQAETSYNYVIEVKDSETVNVKGTINSGVNGIIRPVPTPWDSQTAVSIDSILGGIQAELGSTGLSYKVIGNGIYLSSSSNFSVEVCHPDLMRVMQDEVSDVSQLPNQCRHGYIVKVSNSQQSDEDDYYMKFVGQNNKDGPGAWVECTKPGIRTKLDANTMPVKISRTGLANEGTANEIATFTLDRITWNQRLVGDDTTNKKPEFVSKKTAYGDTADESRYINKILFFRNRLTLLSGEWVVTSRPGNLFNFWSDSALAVGNRDPINISSSSTLPSPLYDGIETAAGLLVYTTNAQYLLSSDDAIFNPDTAKLRRVSSYNYNKTIPPISLGTSIGFVDNSNKYSTFYEVVGVRREGEAQLINQTKVVPTLLDKNIDLITNSRENELVLLGKTGSNIVTAYKYVTIGDQRIQSAWFKWQLKNNLKYHFVIDDQYFFLDANDYLQSINLSQASDDPSITEEGVNYLIHLDNYTTIYGGVYDSTTNLTTFTNGVNSCVSDWITAITNGSSNLVVIDTETGNDRYGRYAPCTITGGSTFTVPGDWATNVASGTPLYIGYLYDYQVDLPRFYTKKQVGEQVVSDTSASLVLHRLKFSFGKIGLYETTLNRIGKLNYTDVHESAILDNYNASDAPYLEETIKTIPVYEKNKNVDVTIKSSHPAPATLRSLSWEGDYSPMYYRRG